MNKLIWRIRFTIQGTKYMGIKDIFIWWRWSKGAYRDGSNPEYAADREIRSIIGS